MTIITTGPELRFAFPPSKEKRQNAITKAVITTGRMRTPAERLEIQRITPQQTHTLSVSPTHSVTAQSLSRQGGYRRVNTSV